MSDGISANERTPLVNALCLVDMNNDDTIGIISRYPSGVAIAYYCDGVIHWMPFPEPPKEE